MWQNSHNNLVTRRPRDTSATLTRNDMSAPSVDMYAAVLLAAGRLMRRQ